MLTIIFESHATTLDNEQKIASGHIDVALSDAGIQQAKQMGQRYTDKHFDAVFCSDLQRSYTTAEFAFGSKYPIIRDARLRECDYGDFERKPNSVIEAERPARLRQSFPHGESYEQCSARMKSFLQDLLQQYDGKTVLVIGHRATWFGLEQWANHHELPELLTASWHWQPGWTYTLKSF
jgi:broad specificity phosphatase PhoE